MFVVSKMPSATMVKSMSMSLTKDAAPVQLMTTDVTLATTEKVPVDPALNKVCSTKLPKNMPGSKKYGPPNVQMMVSTRFREATEKHLVTHARAALWISSTMVV